MSGDEPPVPTLSQAHMRIARLAVGEDCSLADVYAFAAELSAITLDVARVGIWLFSEDRSVMRCEHLYGAASQGPMQLFTKDFPEYIAVLESHRWVCADDALRDPQTRELAEIYLRPLDIRSMLDAPIFRAGKLHGIVCHEHVGSARHWTREDRAFAGSVGDVLAMLVEQAARLTAEKALRDELARQKHRVERERDYLREERDAGVQVVGSSPALLGALDMVDAVAETDATVLLLGESGVGKEVFARAVHGRSKRRHAPLVKVNCASVPDTLFESEFFGHARGSFTGAHKDRVGRFELADGGTLFLDEVGEIPLDLQAKLLRVLQEGEFERVGEDKTRRLDVRIIAATNRDLEKDVEAGTFRRDLYFRLGVFPIAIPPLRERGADVIELARHFLEKHAREAARSGLVLTKADEAKLTSYDWPGNVRELDHVLERAVLLSRTPPLRLDLALPQGVAPPPSGSVILRDEDIRRLEKDSLVAALRKSAGRIAGAGGAAEILGISPSTLRDRMRAFGMSRTDGA